MKTDVVYVRQILDAVAKVERFTEGVSHEEFAADEQKQSAVILQLMLIGEIAKKLSSDGKSRIDLPWKDIMGFRDIAIHDYFSIQVDVIWETVVSDIPFLKKVLQAEA